MKLHDWDAPWYTWDHDGVMGVYTEARRIWIGRDMSVLEFHRRIQEVMDTRHGICWEQITLRITDQAIEWYGDPYEIVGPGHPHSGAIIDRKRNEITMYPPPNFNITFDEDFFDDPR